MVAKVVLCFIFLYIGTVETLQLKQRKTQWHYQTVHRLVSPSVVVDTVVSRTLTGCVSYCSNVASIMVPSLYFEPDTEQCSCNSENDDSSEIEGVPEIVYATQIKFVQEELLDDSVKKFTLLPYKPDCLALYEASYVQNAIYIINPYNEHVTDTWCDMTNGGWTVIQRRMDGSEDFSRSWDDYVTGFGSRQGEYWIGLETIHQLTKNASALDVYMEAYPGVAPASMTAQYSHFKIEDAVLKYKLDVSGFNGTCNDSLVYHNGRFFSTLDSDNDGRGLGSCAASSGDRGWWYGNCFHASLNGQYFDAGQYELSTSNNAKGIHWLTCWLRQKSAKLAVMKIRRL